MLPDCGEHLRKPIISGVAELGGRGHDGVIVQNNPINYVDPTGLFWQYLPAIRDFVYNVATQRPGQTMATLEKCVNYVKNNANRPKESPPPPIEGYNPNAPKPYDSPTAPIPTRPQMYR